MRTLALFVVSASISVAGASAQEEVSSVLEAGAPTLVFEGWAQCDGGVQLDDGTLENGYRIAFASNATYVQRLTPPGYPASLTRMCLCWKTIAGDLLPFSFVVYDDDGPSGQPGTLLGSIASTFNLPSFAEGWIGVDCTTLGIQVASGALYVGGRWNAASHTSVFLCSDESPSTPRATSYRSTDGLAWTTVQSHFPEYRAMGIRAEFEAGTGTCTPTSTALCLNNGRFRVEAEWTTSQGQSDVAQVVQLTPDTGYLWFFNSSNVEAVVKVLDACALNDRYWVFAGGLTNVQTVITVTDTQNGQVKTYTNPQSTPFQPIQDTSAFATCP